MLFFQELKEKKREKNWIGCMCIVWLEFVQTYTHTHTSGSWIVFAVVVESTKLQTDSGMFIYGNVFGPMLFICAGFFHFVFFIDFFLFCCCCCKQDRPNVHLFCIYKQWLLLYLKYFNFINNWNHYVDDDDDDFLTTTTMKTAKTVFSFGRSKKKNSFFWLDLYIGWSFFFWFGRTEEKKIEITIHLEYINWILAKSGYIWIFFLFFLNIKKILYDHLTGLYMFEWMNEYNVRLNIADSFEFKRFMDI